MYFFKHQRSKFIDEHEGLTTEISELKQLLSSRPRILQVMLPFQTKPCCICNFNFCLSSRNFSGVVMRAFCLMFSHLRDK